MSTGTVPLLRVIDLRKEFPVTGGVLFDRQIATVTAVDGVSFDLPAGSTLGLVGESGCGKTTLARMLIGLETPTAGRVEFEGEDVTALGRAGRKHLRRNLQMVFQDPYASLDPRMSVADLVAEPLVVHGGLGRVRIRERVVELLELVGLGAEHLRRHPHEFSGGQRQRIGIARALVLGPRLLILDEPVSALDMSIRAQILNLLLRLQAELGLAYLFIAHDLSVVRRMSDRSR